MRFLVTAGPTREYIDDVRFISNPSSGRMGYAVASAAVAAGHAAILVAGPTGLATPTGVQVVPVTSTQEMFDAVMSRAQDADAFVAAAAPCDYCPARRQTGKLKKDTASRTLRLVRTPDVLKEVGRRKQRQAVIGFALEVQDARANAIEKLERKKLDAIVLNAPCAFGAEEISATVILANGSEEVLSGVSKGELARRLVTLAESIWKAAKA